MDKGCAITAAQNTKSLCIRVIMSSTNEEVVMKLHSIVKTGHIKIGKRRWYIKYHGTPLSGRHSCIKDVYRYMLFGTKAAKFLEKILPFLKTEKTRNKAMLAIQLHKDNSNATLKELKKLGTRTSK